MTTSNTNNQSVNTSQVASENQKSDQHQSRPAEKKMTIRSLKGKTLRVLPSAVQMVEHPLSRGDYMYMVQNEKLDLTADQRRAVWAAHAPGFASFMDDADDVWLTMRATLTDDLVLEWVADTSGSHEDYLGKIVLARGGIRLKIADQLPEADCEALFNSLCDAYKASGHSPLITFCSFD